MRTLSILFFLLATFCLGCEKDEGLPDALVFVANEEAGTISVLDAIDFTKLKDIDLAEPGDEPPLIHNVQVAPDGKTVWATTLPGGGHVHGEALEHLVVIDPVSWKIKERIELGSGLHLAHVVLDDACEFAYATATDSNQVVEVNAKIFQVARRFHLGSDHSPHGLRYFDGKLFIANLEAKSLSILTVADGAVTDVPMGGVAVQAAVTPDGKFVFVSLYDTKEVVRYDLASGELARIALPAGSLGPIQLYPTPDSKQLFVCDQGGLSGDPWSDKVYVLDVANAAVTATVAVRSGAHGVVVSNDGRFAFVTNLNDDSVSVIDVASKAVVATVPVGDSPNGIGFWFTTGGMP
ncbi:MAG: YncE family protein [Bacteroidota bacterium]